MWYSGLSSLGQVNYRVPFEMFNTDIEIGMKNVSILVGFSDLITKPENKGMIDNLAEASRRGSRTYFKLSLTDNIINMYVPKATNSYDYTSIPIHFTVVDDGEYVWDIPSSAEIYECVHETTLEGSNMDPISLARVVSDYAGIHDFTSSGVPTLQATQSARNYSYDPKYQDYDRGLSEYNPETDYIP
jgi:hypothetical protein